MRKLKHLVSVDHLGNESDEGMFFVDPGTGQVIDMSCFRCVSFRTDTVRQLYKGILCTDVLDLFEAPGLVKFEGYTWDARRIGRDSGYQYKLQNQDLGVILLIKSFHASADKEANHLKIELSPHFIHAHTELELQFKIDVFADAVLKDWSYGGVAVHIAADVQGWKPPRDFESKLHCRSRRVRSYHGIESVDFDTMSVTYGRGESFLFGSPAGMQLGVYDKTEEATLRDKLDYWRHTWNHSGDYDQEQSVYRVELRFHHSVVNQFSDGSIDHTTGEVFDFSCYKNLYPHIAGLWAYGIDSFRYLTRPGYFDPAWSLLARQVWPEIPQDVQYKRHYKQADTFSGKNIELFIGNFISCCTRHNMRPGMAWKAIQQVPFYDIVREYYLLKGKSEREFREHIVYLMKERRIRYGRAV